MSTEPGEVQFDLWHYGDRVLQPTQKLNGARDRNKSYEAIYSFATKKLVQLADDSLPTVNVSGDGRLAIANSRERYMIEQMWGGGGTDVYGIDPRSGSRKLVKEKISGTAQLSPDARYVSMYDKGHWFYLQHRDLHACRHDGQSHRCACRQRNGRPSGRGAGMGSGRLDEG